MKARSIFGTAAFAGLFGALACGGSDDTTLDGETHCIPNQTQICTCPNGESGAKECNADGSAYGPCMGCAPAGSNGCQAPGCNSCGSCFDTCTCKGGDPKACVTQCTSGSGGTGGSGGSPPNTGGAPPNTGGTPSSSSGGGGSSTSGATGCEGCVAQNCPSELQSCTSTSGCVELVLCAQSSGCSINDYGCLLGACGSYLVNFGAVGPAMSLGSCAANQCAGQCA